MTGTNRFAVVIAAALAGLVGLTGQAGAQQDVASRAADRAIDTHDPDQVDPNLLKGEDWTFDFHFEHPQPIVVQTPGGDREVYWYLAYTVTNRSQEGKPFVPTFTLYTDKATLRRAGIFPRVFEAVKSSRKIRFLENAVKMISNVMPGDGNARTGVAIFAPLARETDRFTIFVEGLSGRYIERPNLAAAPDAPEDEKVVRLRKTLALTYKLPGDKWWLNLDQPVFVEKRWTWR
jgi:hypothetical protein